MRRFVMPSLFALFSVSVLTAAKPTHKLDVDKKTPDGLSQKVTAALDPAVHRITTDKGVVCEIWFVKSAEVKANFKPTLSVKYPFEVGQLIGALRVGKAKTFTDFRGQELKPGVYTLRYGKQPIDGNHIGTSELHDFLLALPAKEDKDPKTFRFVGPLHKTSAKSAGSTHPAIFSLLPAKASDKASLSHEEDKDLWILQSVVNRAAKEKSKKVPVKMVAVGKTDE